MQLSPITFKVFKLSYLIPFGMACSSSDQQSEIEKILYGQIQYPFAQTQPIGRNQPKEKFVIRTSVGNTEYVIEIPNSGQDYNIEIPLASLEQGAIGGPARPRGLAKPNITDKEMIAALPRMQNMGGGNSQMMDKAFGLESRDAKPGAPSYSLGLAKVRKLFSEKNFEYALIEANQMLAYYPTSGKLHKMKGSIYFRLNNLELAEKAWVRALEINPKDRRLQKGLERLREKQQKLSGG